MPLAQREITALEAARRTVLNGEFDVKNLEAAELAKAGVGSGVYIHDSQQRVGDAIVNTFAKEDALIVTMVAPMQWGKTGVMAAVGRGVVNHPTSPLSPDAIFVITGMSDNDWRAQTQDRFPASWAKNILHRCDLERIGSNLTEIENALFIIDECHFGAQADGLVDKFFTEIGVKSVEALQARNIRIFQTSATPDNVLLEADHWNQPGKPRYHEVIVPSYPETYMSLDRLLREGRALRSKPLHNDGAGFAELEAAMSSFDTPKWHILRLPSGPKSKGKQVAIKAGISQLIEKNGWGEPVNHFGATRMDDDLLSSPPEKHTVIYIKGLLRAAKTLNDSNIGVVYEPFGENKSDSSEAQGLAGRLCGHGKRSGPGAPIVFCNTTSIQNYVDLMDASFNYRLGDLEFKSCTIKKRADDEEPVVKQSFCDPTNIDGIEPEEELCRGTKRETPQAHLSPVFKDVTAARAWCKINGLGGIRCRKANSAGYFESPVPIDGDVVYLVCDRDELDVRGVGLSRQSPKRLLAFYTDKSDRASLQFIVNYRKYE